MRICIALLFTLSTSVVAADEHAESIPAPLTSCTRGSRRLPDSVHLPADLRLDVHRMLERSETFRQQCRRIAAAPLVRIWIRLNPQVGEDGYRPRTTIKRYRSGIIDAIVELSLRSPIEWIAHEFEHVVEQIDGVRVAELASRRDGAWVSGMRMFETARAIRVGRAVLAEMRVEPRRSDKFVD
jgi:hypothetical protein